MPSHPPSYSPPKRRPQRLSPTRRGYSCRWTKVRLRYLKAHPLCVHCQGRGIVMPATEVDHITPHRGNDRLLWDEGNMQALCKQCHSRKTRNEDM